MSRRKVRLIADLIRGMEVTRAFDQLRTIAKHAKNPVEKTVRSALANAEHNFQLKKEDLRISAITVDQGPSLKRWRPRAFGRAAPIKKHSCHLTVVLSDEKAKTKKEQGSTNHSNQ